MFVDICILCIWVILYGMQCQYANHLALMIFFLPLVSVLVEKACGSSNGRMRSTEVFFKAFGSKTICGVDSYYFFFFFVGTKMKAERNTFPSHIKFLSNWRWKLTLFQFLTLCSHHYVSCNVMYPWCFICCMKQLRISVLHIKVFFFLCFSLYSRSD